MKALGNIWKDVAFQFSISGGLAPRLACVLGYYGAYTLHRVLGKDRGTSRLNALNVLGSIGLSRRAVRISLQDGSIMDLDLLSASFLLKEIVADKAYEREPQFIPRRGQVIVDVGAHQGLFSIPAAKRAGSEGKVIAIEPFPGNMAKLAANARNNNLDNIALVACAAAEADGETDLFVTPLHSAGQSIVYRSDGQGFPPRASIRVRTKRLDAVLAEQGVRKADLIKIDAEGSSMRILAGGPQALAARPRLLIELEGGEEEFREAARLLSPLGYQLTMHDSILYAQPR